MKEGAPLGMAQAERLDINTDLVARDVKGGAGTAYIVDGRLPKALLLKLFSHTGLGTEIVL